MRFLLRCLVSAMITVAAGCSQELEPKPVINSNSLGPKADVDVTASKVSDWSGYEIAMPDLPPPEPSSSSFYLGSLEYMLREAFHNEVEAAATTCVALLFSGDRNHIEVAGSVVLECCQSTVAREVLRKSMKLYATYPHLIDAENSGLTVARLSSLAAHLNDGRSYIMLEVYCLGSDRGDVRELSKMELSVMSSKLKLLLPEGRLPPKQRTKDAWVHWLKGAEDDVLNHALELVWLEIKAGMPKDMQQKE